MSWNIDQILASARHLVSYAMGIATVFGISKLQGVDLTAVSSGLDHVFNGVKEIATGIAPLVTIAMAWWASYKQNPAVKVEEVSELPGVKKVVVSSTASEPILAMAADPTKPKVSST